MHGENTPSETYYGDRTSDAFFAWFEHEHKILAAEQAQHKATENKRTAEGATPETIKEEHTAMRLHAKGGHGIEGCNLKGTLHVKRVPGNVHIQFTHENLDYKNSLINATHIVNSLTFGDVLPTYLASYLDTIDAEGPGFNTLGTREFVSEHADRTYEHFIQIVPTIYKTKKTGEVTVYRYTVSSAEHEDTERYPSAKFTFQLSPMAVVISEETVPLYHFLTEVCAIIGGLFTVFSMATGVLDAAVKTIKKGQMVRHNPASPCSTVHTGSRTESCVAFAGEAGLAGVY